MMNRTIQNAVTASAALLLMLGVALPSTSIEAQQQVDAATVAARVQTFYDQTRTLSARFVQRYVIRAHRRTEVSRGQLRIRKPGRMRFDYDAPNGKVIVSDGRRLLVYEPGEEGAAGQYFERRLNDDQLPQALSFLTGTGRLAEDYTFRLLDSQRFGFPNGHVLELRPRRESPHYDRILLYVDSSEARLGVVHRVLILDHSGNRNRFDFQQQQMNRNVADSVFSWRPPANARRVRP